MILLAVILSQVVSLFNHLSTSKIQSDLPVLTRGMAKFPQLFFLFPQLFSLTGGQPLIRISGKVIGLIIQNLRSSDTGVESSSKLDRYVLTMCQIQSTASKTYKVLTI